VFRICDVLSATEQPCCIRLYRMIRVGRLGVVILGNRGTLYPIDAR
jgi:hypothetical protein